MLPLAYVEKFGVRNSWTLTLPANCTVKSCGTRNCATFSMHFLARQRDWRVALCIEARRNDYARGELASRRSDQDDTREADRFLAAFKAIARLKKRGPVKTAKAWALLFTLGCRVCGEPMPTKGEVLRFLESKGIAFVKEACRSGHFHRPDSRRSSARTRRQAPENKASAKKVEALFRQLRPAKPHKQRLGHDDYFLRNLT